ncbi:unnamed protein product [Acanthoscelides obtectus]|uniref:Uncharacterized protein n=1 Tax=Acanthoscelides obtectus TaxID=200917 RepID=A0A9P0Q1V9_ACAOB|nr:unnamed protein product [Acanthoscelides obtectus]CAK1677248.1 hypothetical protein AOBTE_LOCUS31205 [Acanthoscelides obtectus]
MCQPWRFPRNVKKGNQRQITCGVLTINLFISSMTKTSVRLVIYFDSSFTNIRTSYLARLT